MFEKCIQRCRRARSEIGVSRRRGSSLTMPSVIVLGRGHRVPQLKVCLASLRYRNVSTSVTPGNAADRVVEEVHEAVVVDGDELGEDVEAAGAQDDVVDLVDRGDLVGDEPDVALDADADERLAAEAELQRVGDRDDLHDPGLAEALDAAAHAGLGESDLLGDRPVGAAAVALEDRR